MRRFLTFNTLVAIGVIATVLYYLENSRWLPAMLKAAFGIDPSLLLQVVLLLTIFTLLWSLNSHISAVDARSKEQEDGRKTDDYDIRTKLGDLEGRMTKTLNDSLIVIRNEINQQIKALTQRVAELEKIPPEAIAHAERMKPIVRLAEVTRQTFPIVRGGQIIKEWTRDEIRGLPTSQKHKLSEEEPELWKWYLST